MTVYCLIPVHNRIQETKTVLQCLESQDFPDIQIVIVDDGSTDGTAEWIRNNYPEIKVLQGSGYLWWSGAMVLGLDFILSLAKKDDYVLFQNNDTRFAPDYIRTLVSVSRMYNGAVVGSILKNVLAPEQVISIGPKVDYFKTRIEEVYSSYVEKLGSLHTNSELPEVIELEALSGRGTLYPIEVFHRVGVIQHRWLPHYLADYEMSARAKAAGFRILVSTRAIVWTGREDSGINPKSAGVLQRLTSRRSRSNIIDTIAFFSLCGPWYLRITAPIRVLLFRSWAALVRWINGKVS